MDPELKKALEELKAKISGLTPSWPASTRSKRMQRPAQPARQSSAPRIDMLKDSGRGNAARSSPSCSAMSASSAAR